MQERLIEIAQINQQRAHEIIQELNLIPLWASINVEAHLVGSLRMGLLMKHLDIDLHLYSDPVSLADDFRIIARLAQTTVSNRSNMPTCSTPKRPASNGTSIMKTH